MRIFIYITDIEAALKDDFSWSINCSSRDDLANLGETKWYLVGNVQVDLDVDRKKLTQLATEDLNEKIKDIKAIMTTSITQLEARKQNLLALTNDSGADNATDS